MNRLSLLLFLFVAPFAFGDAIDDPWSQVPALPDSCYRDADDFIARLDATMELFQAEEARQAEINAAIDAQLTSMDPMEQQQRMMDFMMENPEQAQEYLLAMTQQGQTVLDVVTDMSEERVQLHTESSELVARYDASLEESMAPSQARYADWVDRFWSEKAPESEGQQRVAEINVAYEEFCSTWWKQGPFHEHFARLRQAMIDDVTQTDGAVPAMLRNHEMMGISTEGYRSTQAIRAAQEYMRQVRVIFSKRWGGPMQYSRPI
ncbi:MAG TPA: hypothetical protein VFG52_00035 [Xanthomonadales bacterium]|nr:hypothetical protein [Xanthomonadales bacterium]